MAGLAAGLALVLLGAETARAAPADPRIEALTQPDGSAFDARLWGDEFINGHETAAGYTVVRSSDGRWVFARLDDGGSLQPTTVAPTGQGRPPPALGLRRHLRDEGELERAEDLRDAAQGRESAAVTTSLGPAPTLVVLVRFTDQAEQTAPALWHNRFFGGAASVADYYDEVSRGQLQVTPAAESSGVADDGVVGWINLPIAHPDTGGAVGSDKARRLTVRALKAADPFVDFAAYDTRAPFGALSPDELHLVILPAGHEAADGCPGPTIWAHRSSLQQGDGAAAPPVLDGVVAGDGAVDGGYVMAAEIGCDGSGEYPQSIGVFAHELGHDLGYVDLYDIDGSTAGVGQWSLMAQHRGQLPGEPSGTHPPHLDPFHKWFSGWVTPTEVTAAGPVALDDAATSGDVAQVGENPGGVDIGFLHGNAAEGEYFLVENRQRTGYDVGLPGCGLLIWHVDETSFTNADESRRLVDVEEAGEATNPDGGWADESDPWPGSTGAGLFDTTSTPDSRRNDGRPTGVSISGFDPSCAPTMHATVDPGTDDPPPVPPVPPNDAFAAARPLAFGVTATGYNEGATREPGEPRHDGEPGGASVWWDWTAPADGLAAVSVDSTFDGVVGVYTGDRVDRLTEVTSGAATVAAAGATTDGLPAPRGPASEHPRPDGLRPEDLDVGPPSFPVEAGVTYHLAVDGRAAGGVAATGGIRIGVRFDLIAVAVTPTPASPTPGQPITVEVTIRDLDQFLGFDLYGVFDDADHDCQPEPPTVAPGGLSSCRFTVAGPGPAGTTVGSMVSVSGTFDDGTFFYHRVPWSATVAARPPTPPPPTPPPPTGPAPIALARTGAEPLPLVRTAAFCLVLGAACVTLARSRRSRLRR